MALAAQLVHHGGALALLHGRWRPSRTLLQVVSVLLPVLRQCHCSRTLQECKAVRLVIVPAASDNR